MTNTYIDMDGVENVAVGVIRQAKKDFIKGAKILYTHLKKIPEYAELIKGGVHVTLSNNLDVRNMYDSWRFVHNDPYSMFGDVGEDGVIGSWKSEAIISYYKDLYIIGARIAYQSGFIAKNKALYDVADSTLKKYIKNKATLNDFIAAKNYIFNIPNGLDYLDEWNSIAYERAKKDKRKKTLGPGCIGRTEYVKQKQEQRQKNKEKAWELKQAGFSTEAIAKYMMVTKSCIHNYIREMKNELDSK